MAEAEKVLTTWLKAASTLNGVRICTETPSSLADDLPCVQLTQTTGTDGGQFSTYQDAVLDFDCFASNRALARTLAHTVRDSLRNDLPGQKVGTDAFVARVQSVAGPFWVPYENTTLRRFVYTAQIRIHSL